MENAAEARIAGRLHTGTAGQSASGLGRPASTARGLGAGDLGLACGLFAAALVLYRLAFQERMFGDGPGLVTFFAAGTGREYHHALYLPVLRLLRELLPIGGLLAAPELASVLGGALGAAGSFLVARGLGAGRRASLLAALFAALSPAGLFFATCVEVYAVHLGAVVVCACVALFGGWDRPAPALVAAVLFFPLLYSTHSIGALYGPGWVALVALASSRRGRQMTCGHALLVVGPLLLAALLGAMVLSTWHRTGTPGLEIGNEAEIVAEFAGASSTSRALRDGMLLPLGLLSPLVVFGAWRLRGERLALAAAALPALLPLAFLAWWGVPERGGYVVGLLPFLAAIAARGLGDERALRGWRLALAAVLLAAHAGLAIGLQRDFDRGFRPRDRVELVRANVGERGAVASAHFSAPDMQVFLPDVHEIDLLEGPIAAAVAAGSTPEEFAAALIPGVERHLLRGPLAVDLAHRRLQDLRTIARATPYVEALVAALQQRYETRSVDDEWWPLLIVPATQRD